MNLPPSGKYKWLPTLYSVVETLHPKKIIELGPGWGVTTITIALACKENNIDANINAYDIWNDSYWGTYNNTLERYKNSYPTKSSMGEFKFEILDLILTSKTTANLFGKWELIRMNDHPNGLFWLDLEKFDKNWLITKDSTISFEINIPK